MTYIIFSLDSMAVYMSMSLTGTDFDRLVPVGGGGGGRVLLEAVHPWGRL